MKYAKSYRAEMKKPAAQRLLALFSAMSRNTNFSIGCVRSLVVSVRAPLTETWMGRRAGTQIRGGSRYVAETDDGWVFQRVRTDPFRGARVPCDARGSCAHTWGLPPRPAPFD
jgi:hypothetical protein